MPQQDKHTDLTHKSLLCFVGSPQIEGNEFLWALLYTQVLLVPSRNHHLPGSRLAALQLHT